MTLKEIKQQICCTKFAVEDITSTKMIRQNVFDEHNNIVGVKETPMNEVFKKIVIFLNDENKQVGSCLLNQIRADALKQDPSCLANAEFAIAMNEWGEDKTPLFKIVGKLYSNVFAI